MLHNPVFITGCPRSGTSLTCGVLAACGLQFGKTTPGGVGNPKGFFEHDHVRATVLKKHMRLAGGSPLGQGNFPRPGGADPASIRSDLAKALDADAYKDPKIALLWDSWSQAFPDSKYIIVRRNWHSIVESCQKASFMDAHSTEDGWRRMVDYYLSCLSELKKRVEHVEIWPDMNADTFREAVDFLGLSWNEQAVNEFIEPKLWTRK